MQILTFNTWGSPYSQHRAERTIALGEVLKLIDADIILLQEVYLPTHRQSITSILKERWPHRHHFASSVLGSGLYTYSRYPIVDADFHRFRLTGKPERLREGDYYAGKGIGLTRIKTPDGMLDVYNCHPHAQYDENDDNEYAIFNETNLYEAARFIHTNSPENPVVVAGDLNTQPHQLGYKILLQFAGLTDAYLQANGQHEPTFARSNPYVLNTQDQTLDYVLVRGVTVNNAELTLTETIPGVIPAYSDHYGVLADISLTNQAENEVPGSMPFESATFQELHKHVQLSISEMENQQFAHIEQSIFGLGSIIDTGFITGWIGEHRPRLARFLRTLLTVGGLSYSAYNLLQMGVNVRSQRNALIGIEQELRHQANAKRLFSGMALEN
jgi:sphingomyelin phosphodiesterase 2